MIDLVFEDMKPFEVIVCRFLPDVLEQMQVIGHWAAANLPSRPLAEIKQCAPPLSLPGSKTSPLERVNLVCYLYGSDVAQQRPDRIALGVVQNTSIGDQKPRVAANRRRDPRAYGAWRQAAGTRTATTSPRAHSSPLAKSAQVTIVFFPVDSLTEACRLTGPSIGVGLR